LKIRVVVFRLKAESAFNQSVGRRNGKGGVPGTVLQTMACGNEMQPGETKFELENFSGRLADNILIFS
jgi:hypothetical protein